MSTEYTTHLILRNGIEISSLAQFIPRILQAVGLKPKDTMPSTGEHAVQWVWFFGPPEEPDDEDAIGIFPLSLHSAKPSEFIGNYNFAACHFRSIPKEDPSSNFAGGESLLDINFWVDAEGITKRIESKHWMPWLPFANYDNEFARIRPDFRANHLAWQVEAARSYYLNRCLMRATNPRLAYAQYNGLPYWYNPLYHWRPGRRSYVIPAFDDYCESVGYACVDNPDKSVQRVPDYVPTGKLWSEIRTLNL